MNKEQVISPITPTDIYSKDNQGQNFIRLFIESADPKWAKLFRREDISDFKIQHRDFYYPVHRNVIFKNISLHVLDQSCEDNILTLPASFNSEMVEGVISCLYSLELKICRNQALEVLDIIHCLHIPKLQKILEEDIKNNIEQYELFKLLEKSLIMGMGQIEQMCLNQLELDSYEQMCYEKFQLLECNQQTFQYVLKHHNQRKWEDHTFGQSQKCIKEVIQEYAKFHNFEEKKLKKWLTEFQQNQTNEFPNFNKNKLTPLKIAQTQHCTDIKSLTPRAMFKDNKTPPKLKSLSPLNENCSSTKSMIVDLTYMGDKKRKGSKGSQHNNSSSKMASDYVILKDQNRQMSNEFEKLKETIENMTKAIKQKDVELRNNKFKLGQIEGILEECENQLMEQNRSLLLLDVRTDKLTMRGLEQNTSNNNDMVESQIIQKKSSQTESEICGQEKPKEPNEKDETLRVSLIASKWVVC